MSMRLKENKLPIKETNAVFYIESDTVCKALKKEPVSKENMKESLNKLQPILDTSSSDCNSRVESIFSSHLFLSP